MMNDADLDMLACIEAGNLVAKGICAICEEPVNPLDPRWDDMTIRVWRDGELVTVRLADDPTERARYASILGTSSVLDGFHDVCIESPHEMSEPTHNDVDSIGRYADCIVPPAWFSPDACGESWDGE